MSGLQQSRVPFHQCLPCCLQELWPGATVMTHNWLWDDGAPPSEPRHAHTHVSACTRSLRASSAPTWPSVRYICACLLKRVTFLILHVILNFREGAKYYTKICSGDSLQSHVCHFLHCSGIWAHVSFIERERKHLFSERSQHPLTTPCPIPTHATRYFFSFLFLCCAFLFWAGHVLCKTKGKHWS